METQINNELIRSFGPCYEPETVCAENESLSILDWVEKYRELLQSDSDIIWLLCRKEFMSDRDMRLFAVWCARESFKLQETVDERSVAACNAAEQFVNGEITEEQLSAAWSAAESAWSAARSAAESAAESAWSAAESAWSAARSAAWSAAESAAESAAWSAAESAAESAWSAARSAARSAAWSAWSAAESAWSAAWSAARSAAWSAQIEKLITYFK